MKFLIILSSVSVLACVLAADVPHSDRSAKVLKQSNAGPSPEGNYQYNFETENKIVVQEVGSHKETVKGEIGPAFVQGTAQYETPDGSKVILTYEADEYGFRPKGDHIPPIPSYIVRSLEYIKQQEALGKTSKY